MVHLIIVQWFYNMAENSKGFFNYRVTRRVFSKSVTSKLHILFKKILAGSLKTLKVTRISAMYTNISHPTVHRWPIRFSQTKNLKLPSGT